VSTAQVKLALRSVITAPVPTVVVLKGKWGRGKTYLWRDTLQRCAPQAPKRWARYSYVSLFGVESLAELRDAVLANADPYEQVVAAPATREGAVEAAPPQLMSFTAAIAAWWRRSFHRSDDIQELAGKWHAGGLTHAFLLRGVRQYLVCIDDVERRGERLRLRDVLGYLSSLRDDRRCSVILILNTDELTKADRDEFELLREKVFDHEITFDPSADDCVDLVFPREERGWEGLCSHSVRLGIENLRVLQRIRKTFERVMREVDAGDAEARRRIEISVPLLALCHYSRESFHPTLAFLRRRFPGGDERPSADPEAAKWTAFLRGYPHWKPSALDTVIADYLENGYLDGHALTEALRGGDAVPG
jgi:hypothetical protein